MSYQTQVKYLCIDQFRVLQVKGVLSDPELHSIVLKAGVYTLRSIGPISYLSKCDLMKVQLHFLPNAFCYLCINITHQNRPD